MPGLTHASSVMPPVRSSELESGTDTRSFTPSNDSACPNRPAAQAAPETVPALLLPEESRTETPAPSLNPNAATRLDDSVLDTVTVTIADVD